MSNLSKHQVVSLIKKWLNNPYLNNNLAILDVLNELGISGIKLNSIFVKHVVDNNITEAIDILNVQGIGK